MGRNAIQTSITSKGQVVIPSAVRRRFGIREGTRFAIDVDETAHRIILTPITNEYVESQRGRFRGRGLLKALAAEKRREREA
jgi:AbrB family looped-hinge helix DNA binding protein